MTKGQKIAFRILFFLYLAGVLVLCFGNFENEPSVPETLLGIPIDKLGHFCMFFPFPILAFLAFDQFTDTVPKTLLFAGGTLLVGILVAIGTEWGQSHLTDYRSGEPGDLVADVIGLMLSTLVVIFWDIRKQRKAA
jgi:VanZ family protein